MPSNFYRESGIDIPQLAGGVNDSLPPNRIADNEAPYALNMWHDSKLDCRPGYGHVTASAIAASSIFGIYNLVVGTADYTTVTCGTEVYSLSGLTVSGGTATLLLSGWDDDYPTVYENFTISGLQKAIMCNGVDTVRYWNGGTAASDVTVLSTDSHPFRFVKAYNNRLFGVDVTNNNHYKLYFSDSGDCQSGWDTNTPLVFLPFDQFITGLAILDTDLFVYKTKSIHKVTPTNSSAVPYTKKNFKEDVGLVAPGSLQNVDNFHVFLSENGFYANDGVDVKPISEKIKGTLATINKGAYNKICSAIYRKRNWYVCAVPTGSNQACDTVLIYDYKKGAWWVFKFATKVTAIRTFNYSSGEKLFFGGDDGKVYLYDFGTNDNGTAITHEIWTKFYDFKAPQKHKRLHNLKLWVEDVGNYSCEVGVRVDFDQDNYITKRPILTRGGGTWDVSVWDYFEWAEVGDFLRDIKFRSPIRGFYFQFTFRSTVIDQPFRINQILALVSNLSSKGNTVINPEIA